MSILEEIENQVLKEYKSGNTEKRVLLQTLKSELINKKKENGGNLSEEEEQKILRKQLKQEQDSVEDFSKAGRFDLVDKIKSEIEVIKEFLPEEMSDEDINKIIDEKIEKSEESNFGKIMGMVMSEIGSKADGNKVSKLLKGKLQ